MTVITNLLHDIWLKRLQIEAVQQRIDEAAGELLVQRTALEEEAKALETEAKKKATFIPVEQRHTLVGNELQLVFTETRSVEWDKLPSIIARYGITEEDLHTLVKVRSGWSIRKVGK